MTQKDSILRAGTVHDRLVTEDQALGRIHLLGLRPDVSTMDETRYATQRIAKSVSYIEVTPDQWRSAVVGEPWPTEESAQAQAWALASNRSLLSRIRRNPDNENAWSNAGFMMIVSTICTVMGLLVMVTVDAINEADTKQAQQIDSGIVMSKDQAHHGLYPYSITLKNCDEPAQGGADEGEDRCRTGVLTVDSKIYSLVEVGDQYPAVVEKVLGKRHS